MYCGSLLHHEDVCPEKEVDRISQVMMTDTELLDVLEALPVEHGGWRVRPSSTGRGWRLLTTREEPHYPSVRDAIRAFQKEREGVDRG